MPSRTCVQAHCAVFQFAYADPLPTCRTFNVACFGEHHFGATAVHQFTMLVHATTPTLSPITTLLICQCGNWGQSGRRAYVSVCLLTYVSVCAY